MLICGSIEVVNVICWILHQRPMVGEWELVVPVNGELLVNVNARVTAAIFTFHCPLTHTLTYI